MKDEEFKRKLSEVAEWIIPASDNATTITAKKKRGRKSREELYQENNEQAFLEANGGINPTIAPFITKLKCQSTTCEDCGADCPNGREKEKKIYEANKKRHWREKCLTCKMFKDPYTGKFDLPIKEAALRWNNFLRESKELQKRKTQARKTVVVAPTPKTIIESDTEIITFYHEKLN